MDIIQQRTQERDFNFLGFDVLFFIINLRKLALL
jgi:hypothetical protein